MGWTLAQWQALSSDERDMWLAYDLRQQRDRDQLAETVKKVNENSKLTIEQYLMIYGGGR
jgi:hypothetical protein